MCDNKNALAYIKTKLKERGYVTNFECIDQRITIRLGALIYVLRKAGWLIDGDYETGTKNFKYTLRGFCEVEKKAQKRKKTYKELQKEILELKRKVADLKIAFISLEKELDKKPKRS